LNSPLQLTLGPGVFFPRSLFFFLVSTSNTNFCGLFACTSCDFFPHSAFLFPLLEVRSSTAFSQKMFTAAFMRFTLPKLNFALRHVALSFTGVMSNHSCVFPPYSFATEPMVDREGSVTTPHWTFSKRQVRKDSSLKTSIFFPVKIVRTLE